MSDLANAVLAAVAGRDPKDKPAFVPKGITDAELDALDLGDMKWAVEGIIPEGTSFLAGPPKLGKSWLALNLALAVAHGGVALGKIKVEQGNVLYLALEDGPRRLQARLRRLMAASGAAPTGRIYFATRWAKCKDGGLAALKEQMEKLKPRLVIVDTLARIQDTRGGNDNAYVSDYQIVAPLQELALELGVAMVFLTHLRKSSAFHNDKGDPLEEVSGSMGLTAAADVILVLKRKRGEADGTLFVTGRDIEERKIPLAWDAEYCLWTMTERPEGPQLSTEQRKVIDCLKAWGKPLKLGDLIKRSQTGQNYESAAKMIRTMANDGLIEKDGYGHYLSESSESSDSESDDSDIDPINPFEEVAFGPPTSESSESSE